MEKAEAFNLLNYPGKYTILLQEHILKTRAYPEIGFFRPRDVIGDKNNPGIIPVSRPPWYQGNLGGEISKAGSS